MTKLVLSDYRSFFTSRLFLQVTGHQERTRPTMDLSGLSLLLEGHAVCANCAVDHNVSERLSFADATFTHELGLADKEVLSASWSVPWARQFSASHATSYNMFAQLFRHTDDAFARTKPGLLWLRNDSATDDDDEEFDNVIYRVPLDLKGDTEYFSRVADAFMELQLEIKMRAERVVLTVQCYHEDHSGDRVRQFPTSLSFALAHLEWK
jgi:hypothetical protein